MTGLLTAAAIIGAIALALSAAGAAGRTMGMDNQGRGGWAVIERHTERRRPLNPQERRWQTLLVAAGDNESRWRELVNEIHRLETAAGREPTEPPDDHDPAWVEDRLELLEADAARAVIPSAIEGDNR